MGGAKANPTYSIGNSTISISGESNVNKWSFVAYEVQGEFSFSAKGLSSGWTSIQVDNLRNGNKKMERDLANSLDSENHPKIRFSFDKFSPDKICGELFLAGVSKEICFDVIMYSENEKMLKLKTKAELNMSDFGVEPPSAFFGAIKSKENVRLDMELFVKKY